MRGVWYTPFSALVLPSKSRRTERRSIVDDARFNATVGSAISELPPSR